MKASAVVTSRHLNLILIFVIKAGTYQSGGLLRHHLKGGLHFFLQYCKLECMQLQAISFQV
jgi:hypothetical protein